MIISIEGGQTSNSYVDLAYVDDYLTTRVGASAWGDLDDIEKEAYILTAARQIELIKFAGLKLHPATQLMAFPRIGLFDFDNNQLSGIPKKLKDAQCELVFWLLTESDRYLSDTDLQQFSAVDIGPLSLQVSKTAVIFPPLVEQILNSMGNNIVESFNTNKNNIPKRFTL